MRVINRALKELREPMLQFLVEGHVHPTSDLDKCMQVSLSKGACES